MLGVWMWPQSVRVHGAEKTVSWCARCGITDIYFLTKGLSGEVSYQSELAPHPDRDLLQELLDAAHARDMRVHAWFTSASDGHYKNLHPESGRYHFVNGRDAGLISLTDEGYLDYMEAIIREVSRYDIDGLHLDYIRYNHLIYGWSEDDLARYAAEGADIAYLKDAMHRMFVAEEKEPELLFDAYRAGNASAHALARTRRKDVMNFATRLVHAAREAKPELILSAALMPEGAYDDLAFADVHYGQNYEDAAKLYDYALPMAYSKAYDKDGMWVRQVAEGTMQRGLKTLVGLHAYEGGTAATLQADIAWSADLPIEGFCLFREGAFVMAFAGAAGLTVYNPMDVDITRLVVDGASYDVLIKPGKEVYLDCRGVKTVCAFQGEKELCVYLVNE